MRRTVWLFVFVAIVAGAGGWYFVSNQHVITSSISVALPGPAPSGATQKPDDDDLNKRRQEGIGSIKDLKPVPIDQPSGR